jgi:Ca2+-binding EF-hand superfamily protein
MSGSGKNSQAMAFVNALQNILDSLTSESKDEEIDEIVSEPDQSGKYTNTYELFIDTTSKKSLSALIICITLVCAMHQQDQNDKS